MSRCVFGIRFWVGLALIFLLFHPMCAEPAVGGTAASAPATQAALSGQAAIAKLRAEGIESALAGRFGEGLDKLHAVVSASPDDKLASAATGLVRQYMVRRKHSESERADEYEQAVARIGRCFLAQDHLSGLAESKAGKLRQQVRDIVADCAEAANSESLEKADDENAAKLKKQALKALAKAAKRLKQVEKRLVKDKSQYAETFRQVAKSLSSCLANCRAGWTAARTTSPEDRLAASQRLKVLENALAEALADVEAMVAKKPWRGALMYGLGAKMLLGGEGQLADQQWYRKLVAEVEAQAKQAMADTRWYDALAAYSGLEELDPDSQTYHDLAKTARKHVRILSLYGKSAKGASALGGQTPATRPGSVPAEQDMDWRTLVANVDVEMIREAISQLDLYYVKVVDYRKLARGALVGIKVLAETPQAAETFGGLKDKTKRAEFLKAVEKLLGDIDKRDNVDHMDVKLVLNSVLGASERTVEIPIEVLAMEFAEGMLAELDRFSSMIWPSSVSDFQKQTMGHFYGVGIQITKKLGEPLKVVTPLADSPAFKKGIKTGDIITAVDGRRTNNLSLNRLVSIITGKKGTKVTLTIERPGELKPRQVTIVRDEIRIRTVKGWQRKPDGKWDYTLDAENKIGYIRITQFTDQTRGRLVKALRQIRADGLSSLVLDLRFNPGGLLRASTGVANEFLRAGPIVSTRGRQTRRAEKKANSSGEYLDGDLVVLVNEHSASAAEIVSGAIKDWRRGIIVGERTFGKGSVQNVIPIHRHKAFLRLTTAYYYLPHGRLLHRQNGQKDWGVDPDVSISITPRQMKRWLDIRRETDLIQDIDAEQLSSELAKQTDADFQLNTALLLLRLMKLQQVKPSA